MGFLKSEQATASQPYRFVVGEWYLKGFADAYDAHWAVVPSGPFGEQYRKGYALGVAVVRQKYLSVLNSLGCKQASVPEPAYSD